MSSSRDSFGGGPPWRRRGWGPPGRPPWWPEGEPWPPAGGPPWRRIGRRFVWRIIAFLGLAFLFMAVTLTAGVVLVATAAGLIGAPAVVRILAIGALLAGIVVIASAGRRFRRIAVDVGAFIDAAGRIETGDYDVQVVERGPREVRTLARAFNAMSSRLASTDRNRRAFVADLTHELRTPLAVIRGQTEAIADGVYPPDQAHIAPILDATLSLETLVEALPTLTLADVGGLRLRREAVDVGVLINSSLAAFQAMVDAGGVQLRAQIAPNTPAIDADPARIRGVLMNLLSNAVRYTPPGGTVAVSAEPMDGRVAIGVRDTGQGIPEELRNRVFERFVKGPGSPGAGLGLAISKDVVVAHGGTIELTSEMGKGTEVRMILPQAPTLPSPRGGGK
jgi:two-component system sensor histidine kinase BaeS